jgi:DNA end-binding protein Ku
LVAIPVDLFPGQRRQGVSLRMLAPDGTPLSRRFYCPAHDRELEPDEIVRGFEIESGKFIVVSDDELDALEPERSRDIDLRVLAPRGNVPPMLVDRTYFLTPAGDSNKAYRLLAGTIEKHDLAGIATFVMRGREYLVAIIAEAGILIAETLRFADELRTPDGIGLPEATEPDEKSARAVRASVKGLRRKNLNDSELVDVDTARLREFVESGKRKRVRASVPTGGSKADEDEETDVVDLMEVLKKRLAGEVPSSSKERKKNGDRAPSATRADAAASDLGDLTRDELYERAKKADVPGRSRMTKTELLRALSGD